MSTPSVLCGAARVFVVKDVLASVGYRVGVAGACFALLAGLSAQPWAVTAGSDQAKLDENADEVAIRELIRRQDEGQRVGRTPSFVFSSGITPRPLSGKALQAFERGQAQKIYAKRPNSTTRTMVRRIVVAGSRDLAYEYSEFRIDWDDAGGARTGFNGSLLRVWRKVGGAWLQDASFLRPHEK